MATQTLLLVEISLQLTMFKWQFVYLFITFTRHQARQDTSNRMNHFLFFRFSFCSSVVCIISASMITPFPGLLIFCSHQSCLFVLLGSRKTVTHVSYFQIFSRVFNSAKRQMHFCLETSWINRMWWHATFVTAAISEKIAFQGRTKKTFEKWFCTLVDLKTNS